jgi:hypothetical protein
MKRILQQPTSIKRKEEAKIATVKTVAEEIWNRMEGTVEILVTSWMPL